MEARLKKGWAVLRGRHPMQCTVYPTGCGSARRPRGCPAVPLQPTWLNLRLPCVAKIVSSAETNC